MIAYFGYGSLVNRDTRPPGEQAYKARLSGWERHWAHREAAAKIDGVVVLIEQGDLAALDRRESGYFRQTVPLSMFELESPLPVAEVFVYQSLSENFAPADHQFPILQSYADCVMAGYERVYGEQGLAEFMRSTIGWQGDILNDRAAPYYPRAVAVSSDQIKRFDALIDQCR